MKTEQRSQAYNLFFQTNLSQSQIARLLDVDRKTIQNWVSDGNWRQQKKLAAHMPSKLAEQYYYMLANMNHEILSRQHQPYPLTHEAEQMRKVAVTLRHIKNRQTVNEAMESFTHLAEMISLSDPDLAAKLRPHIQNYIHNRVDVKLADLVSADYIPRPGMDDLFDHEIRPYDDDEGGITTPPADDPPSPEDRGGVAVTTDPVLPACPSTPGPLPAAPVRIAAQVNVQAPAGHPGKAPQLAQSPSVHSITGDPDINDLEEPDETIPVPIAPPPKPPVLVAA